MKRILLVIFFVPFIGNTQVSDANLWLGVGLDVPITKDLEVSYETQTRFYNNVSQLQNYYNELGLKYSPIKRLTFAAKYRLSRKNRGGWYGNENRFNIDASYAYKIKPANLRLKARLRYQYAFDRFGVVNDDIYPRMKHVGRAKLKVSYANKDFKRLSPYIGYELFTALQPKNPYGIDAYRFVVGIDFDLPKSLSAEIKYVFERENGSVPQNNHIYGISFVYTIKNPIISAPQPVDEGGDAPVD